ncbi:hypothetical protein NL676_024916 [Syzygium grande]|nr:hypothetical protein NL676_024916 [Syzygium grande]
MARGGVAWLRGWPSSSKGSGLVAATAARQHSDEHSNSWRALGIGCNGGSGDSQLLAGTRAWPEWQQ